MDILYAIATQCFLAWAALVVADVPTVLTGGKEDNGVDPLKAWGSHYDWERGIEAGLKRAKSEEKPIMMVVHREWCHACKDLAPKFAESYDIFHLSKKFVLISAHKESDCEWRPEYAPNNVKYVPRIHFLRSTGEMMDVKSDHKETGYDYAYEEPEEIVKSMYEALKLAKRKPLTGPPVATGKVDL